MSDPRQFLLNTDYPVDGVVFLASGSHTITSPTIIDGFDIAHGLPFAPLACMVWSLTADFEVTYILSNVDGSITSSAAANDTNIFVTSSNTSGSTVTIYYRIFAFPPSTADEDSIVEAVTTANTGLTFDTDSNYLKLVNAGILSTTDRTYTHNLGYIPTVFVWLESTHDQNVLAQWVIIDPAGNAGIKVTSTTIEFVGTSVNDTAVEYRIYADD